VNGIGFIQLFCISNNVGTNQELSC